VIDLAAERFTKIFGRIVTAISAQDWSLSRQADAARYIATTILQNCESGALLNQQAVLFRTSQQSAPLEVELTRRTYPSKNSAA